MYATAHRVSNSEGQRGINAFLHKHGEAFPWPDDPWHLPETNPGELLWDNGPEVTAGGNQVHSYLDVIAPDAATPEEVERALDGLWLEFVADELGPRAVQGPLPNPIVYRHARVILRFGVEGHLVGHRALEMAELREHVVPATATWFATGQAAG